MVRAATSGSNAYTEELSYDQNGNIQSLKRWGRHNDGTYKMIDALTYNYNGNQIRNIVDNAGQLVYDGSFDFKSSGSSLPYAFNGNGAMTYDPDKGLTIDYADTGMPLRMVFDSGNATEYVYGADGTKLKVSRMSRLAQCRRTDRWDDEEDFIGYFPGDGDGGGSQGGETGGTGSLATIGTQEYAGPFIINDGELRMFLFDGGYCTFVGSQPQFHYYIKDHLGSNRIVMAENGQVEQKNCYYPFGGVYGDVSTNTDLQPYKYNGKELDRMHGLDLFDYGARMYDPATGLWTSADPLCEQYYHVSPYAYCANNPIRYIDPDGRYVHPSDSIAYLVILNTISPDERQYVVLNQSGNIDYTVMQSHISESDNYNSLMELVGSDLMFNVSIQEDYSFRDNADKVHDDKLSYSEPDVDFQDLEFNYTSGLTTGESGKYGITLLPGQGTSEVNSINNEAHTYIHPSLSIIGKAEALSHELYGHGTLFNRYRDRKISRHDFRGTSIEHNKLLREYIRRARIETVKYYK